MSVVRVAFCATALLALKVGAFAQEAPAAQPGAANSEAPKDDGAPKLPPVKVITAPPKTAAKPKQEKAKTARANAQHRNEAAPAVGAGQGTGSEGSTGLAAQVNSLNAARENILPKTGTNTYQLDQATIAALPGGENQPLDKVLLQVPGIYQDSAASGSLHIRNEHANLQFRLNGIQLPDGVSGFGQVLDTSLIGNMTVVTGALPAQYGLRTAGLVDIQTRTGSDNPSGQVSVYGGSHGTFTTDIEYGGVKGNTEYFFSGRFTENDVGIENPTSGTNAIHDHTQQEKFFGYVSTVLPNNSRWTMITGADVEHYQIPNTPGQSTIDQVPPGSPPGTQPLVPKGQLPPLLSGIGNIQSAQTNEQQLEQNYYGILAFQQTVGNVDYQLSYFSRYSSVHFTPDLLNDLAFTGVATDVSRMSFLNGIQADGAWHVSSSHTLRGGIVLSGEDTHVADGVTVIDASGGTPATTNPHQCAGSAGAGLDCFTDRNDKVGWTAGVYVSDEWKITDKLTLTSGLRFDQMWQYVDANQLSPRVSLVYKPFEGTILHAGYSRYFTPPPQAVGAPENFHLFDNTVAAAGVPLGNPIQPERSHYFDAGVTQQVAPGFEIGVDAYYKIARNLLDDGQFGAAYVLTAFNYAKAQNEGVELKAKYTKDGVMVYGNLAWARQAGKDIVSNQYLIDPDDFAFAKTNFIPTDHSQTVSASAGFSYEIWEKTKASMDMIYGSGLRDGDNNSMHLPGYTQFNLGLSREFNLPDWKPFTLRFDVVNLFDHVYEIRDGSGIGVFAPQFGPRRTFLVGYSQKF